MRPAPFELRRDELLRDDRLPVPDEPPPDALLRAPERLFDELVLRAVGWRALAARVFEPDFDALFDLELEPRVGLLPPERFP